jgi:hypothetical protein
MAIELPWILAPDFLDRILASGLERDQATQTVQEIIRSTRPMPPTAMAPSAAEPQIVRYALPEVRRLDRPLDCRTLDIPTSTIEVVGKMFGDVWAMPDVFRARVEFCTEDVRRLFLPLTKIESSGRVPGDPALVREAFDLMQGGLTKNAAACAVAPRAGGNSLPSSVKRITRALDKMIAGMSNEMSK